VIDDADSPAATHKEPIRKDRHNAESICRRDDLISSCTVTLLDSKVPLFLDRRALKEIPNKDADTPERDNNQGYSNDPDVYLCGGQPQQENADAQFYEHHGNDVDGNGKRLPL
jgi:hypothetical protein